MASNSHPTSLLRRQSQVFVEIRPSSLHGASGASTSSSRSSLKENAPFHPTNTNTNGNMSNDGDAKISALKRKRSDASLSRTASSELGGPYKKPKVIKTNNGKTSEKGKHVAPKPATKLPVQLVSEEYPNGYFYCHQCNKRRGVDLGLQCTAKGGSSATQDQRCRAKYCKPCLKNRYGNDIDVIKTRGTDGFNKRERDLHIVGVDYYFRCPKCKDECNCRNCRKAKGLPPTGNLTHIARKTGQESVADVLTNDSSAKGILPKFGMQVSQNKKRKAKESELSAPKASTSEKAKAQVPKKSRVKPLTKPIPPKPVPKPIWSRIHTSLDLPSAEARILIREFVVRFACLLDLSKGHTEELEELTVELSNHNHSSDVSDEGEDKPETLPWVNEQCAKMLVIGLLNLIASHHPSADGQEIREAVKDIRSCGTNLNRIWGILSSLREHFDLPLSDPLPPPSTTHYNTRSSLHDKSVGVVQVQVVHSAQLVPVLTDLIQMTLSTQAVREEIEQGVSQEKEFVKELKDALAKENIRWKDTKASLKSRSKSSKTPDGDAKVYHAHMIEDLEQAHRVTLYDCLPRFGPLGRDNEGRVYYAVTPGVAEREAAARLVAGRDGKVRLSRKKGDFTRDDRREMRRWSWFIAVWGRKPEGVDELKDESTDDESGDDEDSEESEAWWGFWELDQIRKMADWLAVKSEADSEHFEQLGDVLNSHKKSAKSQKRTTHTGSRLPQGHSLSHKSVSSADLQELAKRMHGYADLLHWRLKRVGGEESPSS